MIVSFVLIVEDGMHSVMNAAIVATAVVPGVDFVVATAVNVVAYAGDSSDSRDYSNRLWLYLN